jgi:DNA-binding response OmpR family regulator
LQILSVGDLEIQLKTRRVLQNGEGLPLTGAEFEILFLLVRSVGKTLTRDESIAFLVTRGRVWLRPLLF